MTDLPRPTVGRIVHFYPGQRLAASIVAPGPWAALITAAPSLQRDRGAGPDLRDHVDLLLCPPNRDPFPLSNVPVSAEGEGDGEGAGWWIWPPRA